MPIFAKSSKREWSMLDFDDNPTERVTAARDVAKTFEEHNDLFYNSIPVESKDWSEKRKYKPGKDSKR